MTKEKLLEFINIIAENNNSFSAQSQLRELKNILINQNVDEELTALLSDAINNTGEIIKESTNGLLNEKQLKIAIERSEENKRRAAAMREYGRC